MKIRRVLITFLLIFTMVIGTIPGEAFVFAEDDITAGADFTDGAGEGSQQDDAVTAEDAEASVDEDGSGEAPITAEDPEAAADEEGTPEPSAPDADAVQPKAAAPAAHKVEVVYDLINATEYNYAWTVTEEAGLQTVETVSVTLLEDGEPIDREGVEATQSGTRTNDQRTSRWNFVWDLPAQDENGEPIEYGTFSIALDPSVEDGTLPKYYTQNVIKYTTGPDNDRFGVTTVLYGMSSMSLKKTWSGDDGDKDPNKLRPKDMAYTIYGNGEKVISGVIYPTTTTQNIWSASRNSSIGGRALPQLDENGEPIQYTVEIDNVPAYYTYELTQFPFEEGTGHKNPYGGSTLGGPYPGNITAQVNFTLLSKSVSATFLWEGDGIGSDTELKNRPTSLNVSLEYTPDGGETWLPFWGQGGYTVSERGDVPNSLKYTWDRLPAVDAEGNPVDYRVRQERLPLYTTSYDEPVDSEDGSHRDLVIRNSYNDNWNYKIDLYWAENDPARKYDISEVTLSTSELSAVYRLVVSVQKHYEPGDMEIRIPYELLDQRNTDKGVVPKEFSLGDSAHPSLDYSYTYRIDDGGTPNDTGDDVVVFYNYKALESNDNVIISVRYNIRPLQVIDCSEGSLTAVATGKYTDSAGNVSEPEEQVSNTITYRLDTGVTMQWTRKEPQRRMYYWDTAYGEEPEDFDLSAYNYVEYMTNIYSTSGSQPHYYLFTDTPGEGGEVYKVFMDNKEVPVTGTDDGYQWQSKIMNPESIQYCYSKVIVRYPRTEHPDPLHEGQTTYETDYTNHLNAKSIGSDEHEGDKGPNDLNDIVEKEADASIHWVDYEFHYTGEIYSTRKIMSSNNTFIEALLYGVDQFNYVQWLDMTVNGYNYTDGYSAEITDDAVYARAVINGAATGYVRLGPEDYYMAGQPSVSFSLSGIDRSNGRVLPGHLPEGSDVTFWGSKTLDGDWEEIPYTTRSEYTYSDRQSYYYYLPGLNDLGYVRIRFTMPEGMEDRATISVNNLNIALRGDSPVLREWAERGDVSTIHLENFAAYELYTADSAGNYTWANPYESTSNTLSASVGLDDLDYAEMGAYRHRKNSGWDMQNAARSSFPSKVTVSETPDPTTQTHSTQYILSCLDVYNTRNLPAEIYEAWSNESAVFYDLLPEGYALDRSKSITVVGAHEMTNSRIHSVYLSNGSTYTTGKAVLDSVETIDDYKGSGRQLVIFRVSSVMGPGKNYGGYSSRTYTGFAVTFDAVGAYEDIPAGRQFNFVEYQRTDGIDYANGHPDTGYTGYGSDYLPEADDGKNIFYDINGDGITETADTLNAYSTINPTFLRTIENGLSKKVKASGKVFNDADISDLDSDYTYRLRLTSSAGGTTKGVIIYDILENAANTEGHTGETSWNGTFRGVSTAAPEAAGIDVKVYYSTVSGLSYNAPENMLLGEAPEGTWTDVCPDDLSTVTAIAFDLRKNKDGTDKEFEENEETYVDIVMRSPAELQDAEFAYNRAAYDSLFIPKNATDGITSFNIGSRTQVALHDLQDILIKKQGLSLTGSGETVPLGGVTFTLYRCTSEDEGHTHSRNTNSGSCWERYGRQTTKADGFVRFENLETGAYRVEETSTVNGYVNYGPGYWWLFVVDASRGTVTGPTAYRSSSGTPVEMGGDAENGFTLTNDLEMVTIRIYKNWSGRDLSADFRPSAVRFNVYRSKGENAEKELYRTVDINITSSYQASASITGPKYYDFANQYVYTVEEVPVDGYTTTITKQTNGNTYTFRTVNTQTTKEITAVKAWSNADGTSEAPEGVEVTFELYEDGKPTGLTVTLDGTADETVPTGKGGYEKAPWTAGFVNLITHRYVKDPATGETEAREIDYTLKEVSATPGYAISGDDAALDGGTITNKQEETSITVKKAWDNADGTAEAPEGAEITFTLLADGEETDYMVTLDGETDDEPEGTGGYESDAWTASFIHLPKYRVEDGKAVGIEYSVKETVLQPGYSIDGEDAALDGGTITNKQEETSITVNKAWDNADGTAEAPEGAEITFTLLADGEETDYAVTLDGETDDEPEGTGGYESGAWTASFIHLPKYRVEDGKAVEIEYSVKETVLQPGYSIDGEDAALDGGTITNKQEETSITVNKAWDNADGTSAAPEGAEITFTLLADGEETDYTVTLDGETDDEPEETGGYESDAWTASFIHLPKYRVEDGKAVGIGYSVKETVLLPGYSIDGEDTALDGGTITNKQEETSITVNKVWDNADGTSAAPEGAEITFTLLADGEETDYAVTLDGETDDEPEITGGYESGAWTASFIHLPKYRVEDGKAVEIEYSVKETVLQPGYSVDGEDAALDGGTITNKKNTESARIDDSVTIRKVGDDGKALSGATFALYAGDKLIASYSGGEFKISTDDDKLAAFLPEAGENLSFTLKEISAPAGYDMTDKVSTIVISAAAEEALVDDVFVTTVTYTITIDGKEEIEIVNPKIPEGGTDGGGEPKTGDDSNMMIWLALFAASASALITAVAARIRRRRIR